MTEYDNTNRGSIWKNDKKETDKHPDFTGSLNVNGVEYWVSAWKRKPDASEKAPALSFSIKPKLEPVQQSISQRAQAKIYPPDRITSGLPPKQSIIPADDEDIPF